MNRIALSTTLVLAATPFALPGGDIPENPNRLSFGARAGFNFRTEFHNSATANPGPATGGVNHLYDDGYVLLDSSGNAGGLTWNWGYQNAAQVVGDTLQFHATQSSPPSAAAQTSDCDDPQYGIELTYQRFLGAISGSSAHWGLEAGFSYTDLDLSESRSATGPVTVTTDTFQLNGVTPPGAGYNGSFDGPGPLLGDTPTRTTLADTGTLSSQHSLRGQMYGLRLGPFVEWNLTSQLSLAASMGLALAPTSLDYDFSEATSLAGGGTSVTSGQASRTEVLYGFYLGGLLRYEINKSWGIYAGAQFQNLNDMRLSAGSRTAELDPQATFYATLGASWRF